MAAHCYKCNGAHWPAQCTAAVEQWGSFLRPELPRLASVTAPEGALQPPQQPSLPPQQQPLAPPPQILPRQEQPAPHAALCNLFSASTSIFAGYAERAQQLPLSDSLLNVHLVAGAESNTGVTTRSACSEAGDCAAVVRAAAHNILELLPLALTADQLQRLNNSPRSSALVLQMTDRLLLWGKHGTQQVLLPDGSLSDINDLSVQACKDYLSMRGLPYGTRMSSESSFKRLVVKYASGLQTAKHDIVSGLLHESGVHIQEPLVPCPHSI